MSKGKTEYEEDEQDKIGAAGHFRDWLAERTDEIKSVRIENDEGKGVTICTDHDVEIWLDEMWGLYLEEYWPGGVIK